MKFEELELPSNIFYSPLAGCSDFPFRQMSAKWNPGLMFCEMVKMEAVIRRIPAVMRMLEWDASMRPIGAQLCGSNLDIAAESAKMIEDMGFDVLDFNCGCPVDKVTNDGSGSGMLKDPEKIGEMIHRFKSAVKIPVTVKIRAGWSDDQIVGDKITQIAESAGASAITVHGRTRQQGYKGPAKWDWIKSCVQARKSIKVIGNGDVFSPEAAKRMLDETGCDGVMVSRGTLGKPWIAEDINRHLKGLDPIERDFRARREVLDEHFEAILRFSSPEKALLDMRRVGCYYLNNASNMSAFRQKMSHARSLSEAKAVLQEVMCE